MRQKLELSVEWRTNEYYDMDTVTLLLVEEKIAAIQKAKTILAENPDFDSIRIMIDENCIASDSTLHRLGYGFVLVRDGDALYFIGTDHYDSSNQVETEPFELEEDEGIPEEPDSPENFSELEIEEFKSQWGQSHKEICINLELDTEGADEYLMGGYFWLEDKKQWYPKDAGCYSDREQEIANYLRFK